MDRTNSILAKFAVKVYFSTLFFGKKCSSLTGGLELAGGLRCERRVSPDHLRPGLGAPQEDVQRQGRGDGAGEDPAQQDPPGPEVLQHGRQAQQLQRADLGPPVQGEDIRQGHIICTMYKW